MWPWIAAVEGCTGMIRIAPLVLSALLVASSLALVTSQYRSRELFAELEIAQQETKSLDAEGSRLRSDLGRASQPATVEAVARRLGMRPINPDRTVMLPALVAPAQPADAMPTKGRQ